MAHLVKPAVQASGPEFESSAFGKRVCESVRVVEREQPQYWIARGCSASLFPYPCSENLPQGNKVESHRERHSLCPSGLYAQARTVVLNLWVIPLGVAA